MLLNPQYLSLTALHMTLFDIFYDYCQTTRTSDLSLILSVSPQKSRVSLRATGAAWPPWNLITSPHNEHGETQHHGRAARVKWRRCTFLCTIDTLHVRHFWSDILQIIRIWVECCMVRRRWRMEAAWQVADHQSSLTNSWICFKETCLWSLKPKHVFFPNPNRRVFVSKPYQTISRRVFLT